jgi:Protein of unknown function (DUF3987)
MKEPFEQNGGGDFSFESPAAIGIKSPPAANRGEPEHEAWRASNPAAPADAKPFSPSSHGARFLAESESLVAWREVRRWVLWRWKFGPGGKPTKVPYQTIRPKDNASSSDPETWWTFDDALGAAEPGHAAGIGFMFGGKGASGYAGIDLDKCRNPATGEIDEWASTIVQEYGAYTEISVSGDGLHILGRTNIKVPFGTRQKVSETSHIEVYCGSNRYFCMTGNALAGHDREPGNLDALLVQYQPEAAPKERGPKADKPSDPAREAPAWILDDLYTTPEGERSEKFYAIVAALKDAGWDVDDIEGLFEAHPDSIVSKYEKRLRAEIERAFDKVGRGPLPGETGFRDWGAPRPIPDGLLPVLPFQKDFLPPALQAWVLDIVERMQCPIEFVAIPALVALGSMLGRKIALRPKERDDWFCIAHFWGMVIGEPGQLKSPAISNVLKPVNRLEKEARKRFARSHDSLESGS